MKSLFPDLSHRAGDLEIMDDLNCSGEVVYQTLRELDVINRWLGGNAVTLGGIKEMIRSREPSMEILTIADLGCGSGDLLMRIAEIGRQENGEMKLTGFDANPHIADYARIHVKGYPEITIETADVLSPAFAVRNFDIISGTLFFHHFTDEELIRLLSQMRKQARLGLLINDIHRHWLALASIRVLTRLFSSSSMVRFDAPLSVRRAFTRADWEKLLLASGISRFRVTWKWAFRWQIGIPAQGSRLAQFW